MKILRDTVVVDAHPEDAFEFFRSMDRDRDLAWHDEHRDFRLLEGECIEFRDENWLTRLFNPKNVFVFEPVDGGTRVVAEVNLRIGPLERLSRTVHTELEELRRHVREEGENLKRLVEAGLRDEREDSEATAT